MNKRSNRTKTLVGDISLIAIFKILNIISSFIIIPITINYVNTEIYGIWLTLYSIVTWFSVFDIGLGNGLRNTLAKCLANNEYIKSKQTVSTAYIIISIISLTILSIGIVVIYILNWEEILKIPNDYDGNIKQTLVLFMFGFCLRFVAQLISNIFFALQKAYLSELLLLLGNLLTLTLILCFKNFFTDKLQFLVFVLVYPGIICMIIYSLVFFKSKAYSFLSPSISFYDQKSIKDLFSLGIKFFILQCSSVISYSIVNFLILRFLSADEVTKYNIAYKYFSILLIANNIICTPLWSTFTEAYVKKDYTWMKSTIKYLIYIWLFWCFIAIIMVSVSDFMYKLWTGIDLQIPLSLSIILAMFMLNCAWNGIFTSFINGVGKVYVQMITGIIPLILWVPLIFIFVNILNFGVSGFALCMLIFNLLGTIFTTYQVKLILTNKAVGIWNK